MSSQVKIYIDIYTVAYLKAKTDLKCCKKKELKKEKSKMLAVTHILYGYTRLLHKHNVEMLVLPLHSTHTFWCIYLIVRTCIVSTN